MAKEKIIKNAVILYCAVFTAATIISSAAQLCMGQATDTNAHILDRAVICLIGVFAFTLTVNLKLKNRFFSLLISYVVSIFIVFTYVFISGFFEELHPNAYRDIFLNFTAVFIIAAIALLVKDNLRKRKGNA